MSGHAESRGVEQSPTNEQVMREVFFLSLSSLPSSLLPLVQPSLELVTDATCLSNIFYFLSSFLLWRKHVSCIRPFVLE